MKNEDKELEDIPKEQIEKTLKEGKVEQKYLDLAELPKNKEMLKKEISKEEPKPESKLKPQKTPDKTIEINIPKEPKKEVITKELESNQPFYEPVLPHRYAKIPTTPIKEKKNKIWLIWGVISIALILELILAGVFIHSFSKKDFSPEVNVQNSVPNTENQYNHTIINNQTIVIQIDEDIAEFIANKTIEEVKKQLNITNSS